MKKKKIIWIVAAVLVVLIAAGNCGGSKKSKSDSGNTEQTSQEDEAQTPDTLVCNLEWRGSTATIKLITQEGRAQLIYKDKTYYGQCMYGHPVVAYEDSKDVDDCWIVSGFTGTDKIDMTYTTGQFKGESWYWNTQHYIDLGEKFIYLNSDTYVAKNPEYRIPITVEK